MFPVSNQPFIDELVRTRGLAREAVVAEVVAIARAAATRLLGSATPLAVDLGGRFEAVRVAQVLTVARAVQDPARELALADARRVSDDAEVGDELEIEIDYTDSPLGAARREELAAVADRLPLPLSAVGLWDALGAALDEFWQRHFPTPAVADDSLWALLRRGGGWLVGQEATADGVTLRVADTRLAFTRLDPHGGWVDAELTISIAQNGATTRWLLPRSDNDALARRLLGVPTGPEARDGFVAELAALAADVAAKGTGGLSENTAAERLLTAAILPPRPGSLWAWCEEHLPALLGGHRRVFTARGRALELAITGVSPPARGLRSFGASGVELTLTDTGTGEAAVAGETLGGLERAALTLPGPDPAAARDVAAMAATWLAWLEVHVAHHLSREPFELNRDVLYAMAGHFPLVELIAARVQHGPPPPLPVPPPGEEALARAAATVRPASEATLARVRAAVHEERVIAALEAGPYAIVLADDRRRAFPFADAFVGLLAPGVDGVCEVMRVDAWNPPSRAVVDGDALAFRRFCEWLGEALVRGGLDAWVEYTGEDDAEDEDAEEDEDGAGVEPEGPARLRLSEWLRFGLPDVGDRFLVDWRHQWHVVFAGAGIVECFGGIYGMRGEQRERLEGRDRRVWRAFLREVIDPRFAA